MRFAIVILRTRDTEHTTLRQPSSEHRECAANEDRLEGEHCAKAETGVEEVERGEPQSETAARLLEREQRPFAKNNQQKWY